MSVKNLIVMLSLFFTACSTSGAVVPSGISAEVAKTIVSSGPYRGYWRCKYEECGGAIILTPYWGAQGQLMAHYETQRGVNVADFIQQHPDYRIQVPWPLWSRDFPARVTGSSIAFNLPDAYSNHQSAHFYLKIENGRLSLVGDIDERSFVALHAVGPNSK